MDFYDSNDERDDLERERQRQEEERLERERQELEWQEEQRQRQEYIALVARNMERRSRIASLESDIAKWTAMKSYTADESLQEDLDRNVSEALQIIAELCAGME